MARQLILHIGHPKTGTTTFQRTLKSSRQVLAEAGILYPDTGPHHNHKILLPFLVGRSDVDERISRQLGKAPSAILKNSERAWNSLVDQVNTSKPRTIILSSEQFFQLRNDEALDNIAFKLRKLASEFLVVAYLREPASFTLSRSQQHIKRNRNLSLIPKNYYRSALERYLNSGLGSVNARIFDRNVLNGGDIVKDFFEHYVQTFNPDDLTRSEDSNVTFSSEGMALLQEVHRNERKLPSGKARYEIAEADFQLAGLSRPRMHKNVLQAVRSRCTDLDWLNDNFGLKFLDCDTAAMSNEDADRLCGALDRVKDMCVVDEDRKAELWKIACERNSGFRRLTKHFRGVQKLTR